jgi:hypothetical protein
MLIVPAALTVIRASHDGLMAFDLAQIVEFKPGHFTVTVASVGPGRIAR